MLFHNIDIYYFMADGIAIWEILFKYQYMLFEADVIAFLVQFHWQML